MRNLGTKELKTERLVLRRIKIEDAQDMFERFASREECSRYFPWSAVTDLESYKNRVAVWVENYQDDLYFQWIIEWKETKDVIGIVNLHGVKEEEQSAETSYILAPDFWGKGVMTEALQRVLEFAFMEVGFNRVEADVFYGNEASERVLLKRGMKQEGVARDKYFKDEKFVDAVSYAMLRRDWKLKQLETPEDIYEWMEENIEYGWIDADGNQHIREMKNFRRDYHVMSLDEILKYKMGTCIDQVKLMHELLKQIGMEHKMFCCRIFEPDDYGNLEEEEHMHCFVLFYRDGKAYHLEHPNFETKGIYEYNSEDEAIKSIVDYYIKLRGGKESPTTQIVDVPDGMTFREFNAYVNQQEKNV